MFAITELDFHQKSAEEIIQHIPTESRRICEDIMDRVYKDDPSNWPEGLSVKGHESLYMIREASTGKPVGFTGWQEFSKDDGKKVGYYTIGILPEYRQNGYAKEAVQKLIREKSSSVDRVEAFIAPHNVPSLNMAKGLGVDIVKSAMFKKLLPPLTTGLGTAGLWDYAFHKDNHPLEKDYYKDFDRTRAIMFLINAMGGGLAHKMFSNSKNFGLAGKTEAADAAFNKGITSLLAIPAKDLMVAGIPTVMQADKTLKHVANADLSSGRSALDSFANASPLMKALVVGGGLGLGALGIHQTNKAVGALRDMAASNKELSGSRLNVTLPSKDKYDHETVVNMPIMNLDVSDNMQGKLNRDVRRRIYRETKERTVPRKKKKREEEDTKLLTEKSASLNELRGLVSYICRKK